MGAFWLLCFGVLAATAVSGCPVGRDFITAFMPNYLTGDGEGKPTLYITAPTSLATVTVEARSLKYKATISIPAGTTKTVVLPPNTEISLDEASAKTVTVASNADITVMSAHLKPYTGDTSVILPNHQLGKSYVVFTPNGGPLLKVTAIVNGNIPNTIVILPYADLVLKNGRLLKRLVKTTVTLAPYEVFLLRSDKTLSGTKINSQFPVAVLSGHECLAIVATCEHVYEQLVPVERLVTADEYLVPAMHDDSALDTAHVVAVDDSTDVTVIHGTATQTKRLYAGELLEIIVKLPTVIRSNKKIMVMYSSSNVPNDEFLTNIIPVSQMYKSWTIFPLDDFTNTAVTVSEVGIFKSFLSILTGNSFPGDRKYAWSIKSLSGKSGPVVFSGDMPQAVYVFGGKVRHGYATTGVCFAPSVIPPPIDPCVAVKCNIGEQCQNGVCVRVGSALCWAVGDPHYKTFDGKFYDFQGTCSYTMATTVNTGTGIVPFTIAAKNNNRGSNYVSFVRTVTISVYNYTIAAGSKAGMVEVNGVLANLPITLVGGKLRAVQSGGNALITTDFGLEVKYDWKMMLYIRVPATYSSSLGGLCGNYNGDRADEQIDTKGTQLSTVLDFAKSWKVADGDLFCHDDCAGKCLACTPELKAKYSVENYCGLLQKTNGPFDDCHSTVDPHMYIENCVYDVCINKGIRSFVCENMRGYADACLQAGVKIDANWRELADCPLPCPENSHYEACGTACAASCAERDAPTKCDKPCVEGCQCNTGFILSGGKCVPVKECGCMYEGQYYPPTEAFWGDTTCTKKCTCNPLTGLVSCVATNCKTTEICNVKNGVRDCYPQSIGHCRASGDPHYLSFDGKAFNFQGTCTYYLSKLVDKSDTSLVPFEVLVKNENRGMNKAVSFTKTVQINIFNDTIILSKDNFGKVLVNNLYVNLPYDRADSKLSIFRSGYFGIVKTNFGMNVRYNWKSFVSITLPSTYSKAVGGLCGNWNGNLNDDLSFPNSTLATSATAFGTSWKARNDAGCTETCQGKACPQCEAAQMTQAIYTKPCSMITDTAGPFKDCHSKVDPAKFYEDCLYDMCMYGGHSTALCSALTAYTAACQTKHAILEQWRSDTLCPASCKANSHYDVCSAGCPQTCSEFAKPDACQQAPCIEGCVCDDGFVLSNGECVTVENCGCNYEGKYYKLGEVFFPKGQCDYKCVCKEQEKVTCQLSASCAASEQCEIRDGVLGCQPQGTGSCSVSGSGRYRSFDGNTINALGNCAYTMVEVTPSEDKRKVHFSVSVQQVSSPEDAVVTRGVDVEVAQYKISMIPGLLWEIRVDNVKTVLPLSLEEGLVTVHQIGSFILLETTFGLKVTYDTVSIATVEIPSTYKNSVQGLCGNFNVNKADDLLVPDGTQASTVEKFLSLWKADEADKTCQTGCPQGATCKEPDTKAQTDGKKDCSILTVENGPFSNCYSKLAPQPFLEDCARDVASNPEDKTVLCRHIQKYVAQCQLAGISVSNWRNTSFCPMTCPANTHYEICADTCTSTCASLSMANTCPPCLEGCQCDEGTVFNGAECTPVQSCGCLVNGNYYKSGQTVVLADCTKTCTCKAGQLSCQAMKCTESEVCRLEDNVLGCVLDPCLNVKCRKKESCVEVDGRAVCQPKSKASCQAIGDPHYQTFDGSRFSFQGTCSYTLVKTTGEDKTLNEFSIIYKNELAEGGRGSNMKSATIKTPGHEITIVRYNRNKVIKPIQSATKAYKKPIVEGNLKEDIIQGIMGSGVSFYINYNKYAQVDGQETTLPVSLDEDAIKINQVGIRGVLATKFGLEVAFDWGEFFKVTVTSSYFNNLQGMCGTYNDDDDDDFVTPEGVNSPDIIGWATSWSVPDNDPTCWHFPACSEQNKRRYQGPEFCGLLSDKTGPFGDCTNTIKIGQFAYDCLFYTCLTKGSHDTHCKVMSSFANACEQAGTDVSPEWKEITKCT